MAITKVAEGSATIIEGGGSQTVSFAGWGLQQNDYIVAAMCSDESLNLAEDIVTSGYSQIAASDSASPGLLVVGKRMGSTPDTGIAVDQSANVESCLVVQAWRGVDTTTAIDAAANSASGGSGDPDAASHTTVTNGALRILVGGLDDDDVASGITAPSGYTDLIAADSGGGAGSTVMMASKIASTAGAENPGAFTTSGDDSWFAYHFSLRPAAGATAYEIDADAGAYTHTGTAVTLKTAKRVAADAGVYSHNGQAVTLSKGQRLSADAGAYLHSGSAVAFYLARKLVAVAGAYAHTGSDVILRRALPLIAEAGTYLHSGQAATLLHALELAAEAGSYSHNGQSVGLQHLKRLVAAAGAYEHAGQDVALVLLDSLTLLADSGIYSHAGQGVELLITRRLIAEAGSYQHVGTAADFTHDGGAPSADAHDWLIRARRRAQR